MAIVWLVCVAFLVVSPAASLLLSSQGTASNHPSKGGILAVTPASVVFTTSANSTTPAYVGDSVTFWATGTSNGTDLTFTFYYDYWLPPGSVVNPSGGFSVNVTTSPGAVVTEYVYDHAGNFTGGSGTYFRARLTVSDGFTTVTKGPLPVYVINNRPPVFNVSLEPVIDVTRGVPKDLGTNVSDPDNDSIVVTWDFGDGTANETNGTGPAIEGVWVNQTHTWNPYVPPGGFSDPSIIYLYTNLTLTLDDGQGNLNVTTYEIRISLPRNNPPSITLAGPEFVDFGTLAYYNGSARDVEGESLTWTFDYGDGSLDVYNTTGVVNQTLWTNVTHPFAAAGTYSVVLYVSDRLVGDQTFPHNVTASVSTKVVINQPPGAGSKIAVIPEENLVINATTHVANCTMYIQAQDPDGDVLTVVWDFGDGSPGVTNISSGGIDTYRFTVEHEYSVTGQYNVSVNITDGRIGHEINRYRLINVTSTNNPPEIVGSFLEYPTGRGNYAELNESVTMILILADAERDFLNFTVDYGDGSELANFSLSVYDANGNLTFTITHSYKVYGTYNVRVNITDDMMGIGIHILFYNFTIRVAPAPVVHQDYWSWWDFASLGLFMMIPVMMVAWIFIARRQQRILDDAGMTYEQWVSRKPEIKEELKLRKEG